VNKSFLKFLTDFGPLLIFFFIYYRSDKNLSAAIPPLIIATIIAVIFVYFLEKKIPYIPIIGGFLVSLFGGLTIYFSNPIFLYIKPTIINIIFAFALILGKIFFKKNLLKSFFSNSISLQKIGWDKLMYRWINFFIFLAVLNEIIWRTQTEEFWVNFKVWGILIITFIFTFFQVPLINKYKDKND
tara:strand:+ start:3241 stop:3795 length:555 start_codon:yes stop_codon:yes gene_type:complete